MHAKTIKDLVKKEIMILLSEILQAKAQGKSLKIAKKIRKLDAIGDCRKWRKFPRLQVAHILWFPHYYCAKSSQNIFNNSFYMGSFYF